jgi:hypothetical protein
VAWSFLAIVEHGAETKGLFPVPTGTGVGIQQLPGDTNPITYKLYSVSVHRSVDNAWERVQLCGLATLVISDLRVAVVCQTVPQTGSSAAGQADASHNGHAGRSRVGHVLLNQIKAVGARDFAAGINKKLPSLRFLLSDRTTGIARPILVQVIFTGKPKASAIGDDIVRRIVERRIASPAFAPMSSSFDGWRELSRRPFAPARGEFEVKTFSHFKHVVALDPEWGFAQGQQTDETSNATNGPVAARKEFTANAVLQLAAGHMAAEAGKDREALKCYMDSTASSHNAGDSRGELRALLKVAEVFNRLGGFDEAINCSARAIQLSVGQADRRSEGLAFAARGVALKGKQHDTEASGAFDAALSILQPEWPELASWVRSLA